MSSASGMYPVFMLTQVMGDNLGELETPPSTQLTAARQTLGRSERCELQVYVPSVSRQHAAIWLDASRPMVEDLGSGAGTFVNTQRISEVTALNPGDLISLGPDAVFLLSSKEATGMGTAAVRETGDDAASDSGLVELALHDATPDARFRYYVEILARLVPALETADTVKEMMELTLAEVARIVPSERLLVLKGTTPETLEMVAWRTSDSRPPAEDHPPSQSILKRAITTDRPVISFDARTDRRFRNRPSIALNNVRSALCTGIRGGGQVWGLIYCDSQAVAGLHSTQDGEIIALIGRCVGAQLGARGLVEELHRLKAKRTDSARRSEDVLTSLDETIRSHLNRLELIADDAETEQKNAVVAQLLRAERERLVDEVDRIASWSEAAVTRKLSAMDHAVVLTTTSASTKPTGSSKSRVSERSNTIPPTSVPHEDLTREDP